MDASTGSCIRNRTTSRTDDCRNVDVTQGMTRIVPLRAFRGLLHGSYAETRRKLLQPSALRSVRKALEQVHDRASHWHVAPKGWSVLGWGMKRVYAAGLRALSKVQQHPSVANLHEWRKQVNYLWHHLELLAPLWP